MVEPVLSVADLSVRIAGLHILKGVSFEVAPTAVTVLHGRNGVGKTTTLRAIVGLTPRGGEVRGSVRMGARSLLARPTHRLVRDGLGYVPEDRCVFAGLTVAENLRLAERRGVTPAYDKVFALFPELERRGRQRAGSLSGGQQQMLAIGRVLLNDNRLLLVDEPTKGLAPKVVTEVAEVLERVAESVPVLLVEQNLAVVRRLATDAVVLSAGKVAWTGDARELLLETALTKTLEFNGIDASALDCAELYSCFPCIPKLARRAIGWPLDKPMSVAGGLTFAGGPVGNYMSHAIAAMTVRLRREGRAGLLFGNGGFANTNHCIVLTRDAPQSEPRAFDVQADADAQRGAAPPLLDAYEGDGEVETYTVFYGREGAARFGVVVGRNSDGARFLARIEGDERDTLDQLTDGAAEPVGTSGTVKLGADGVARWRFR